MAELTKRDRIVNELYSTEESYVNSLKLCIKYYYDVMLTSSVIPKEQTMSIFVGFPDIIPFNDQFLQDMKVHVEKKDLSNTVGKVMLNFVNLFRSYKTFVGNNDICLHEVSKMEANPDANAFLEQCRLSIEGSSQQTLRSYLIMPVCS